MLHHLQHFHLSLNQEKLAADIKACSDDGQAIQRAWALLKPQAWWRDLTITQHTADQVILGDDQLIIPSVYVAKGLAQCHKATVIAVTIGAELPRQVAQWQVTNEWYQSTIGDLVGSHSVEQLAEQVCQYLQARGLPQGLFGTLRFSPGYGDWALCEQVAVMQCLEDCQGQITLTENYLLEPIKSITAVIGWSQQWQKPEYPQGNHGSGFCNGGHNCAACTTWACRG